MPADTDQTPAARQRDRKTPKPDRIPTEAEMIDAAERQSGFLVLRKVAPYLWPKDMPWVKRRVVLAMLALLVSKLIIVATPFFYRDAVDALAGEGAPMLALGAIGLTVAYGMARLMGVGFQ
ncbi:MAG: metal ABC transporter permease, partial [Sulfitobacter sp.]